MKKLDGIVCDGCGKLIYPTPKLTSDKHYCSSCALNMSGYIDNFDLINNTFINFGLEENYVYLVQIISRTKDGGNGKTIKSFIVPNKQLEDYRLEIIDICTKFNARAYIQLNPCKPSKIQWEILKTLANYLESGCPKICGLTSSACSTRYEKHHWIIDIDEKNWNLVQQIHHLITQCESEYYNDIITAIPTISGWHLVVSPFNFTKFYQLLEIEHLDRYEVKKQAMTLLYCDIRSI